MTQDSHSFSDVQTSTPKEPRPANTPRYRAVLLLIATAIAGACTTVSMAPWDYWPVGLISFGVFAVALSRPVPPFLTALVFACGFFGTGASWVYVSIHQFGMTSKPLAVVLTSLFVLGLAIVFALPYLLFRKLSGTNTTRVIMFGAPGFWLFGEWLRGWLLTGFPWLYLGYGHLNSPLAGYAPIGGVLLISAVVVLTSSSLIQITRHIKAKAHQSAALTATAVATVWIVGAILSTVSWTKTDDSEIGIGIVQANIPQELKWLHTFRKTTLDRYTTMSDELWQNDIIIWPEAAVPMLYQSALPFLEKIQRTSNQHNSAIITGILSENFDTGKIHNSIVGIGEAEGIYHKTRLVPFGEYVPLEEWIRGTLAFFNLPTSIIAPGDPGQQNLRVGELTIAPSICYEVVYPTLVANSAKNSHLLLTISNDAWFGDSIGPLQHMQMAQMRALETQRYLVRATNNGISAVVDPTGSMVARTEQFTQETLSAKITPITGNTPFMIWQNTLVISIFVSLLFGAFIMTKNNIKK